VDALGGRQSARLGIAALFASFAAAAVAFRILIVWVHANTGSVLVGQLLHASSTGSLVAPNASRQS
jgi:hypothetical protein